MKRICPSCGAKFYDLGQNPAKCPKCGVAHDVNAVVKTRRRSKASTADSNDPLAKVAAKNEAKAKIKIKKPVKEIEDVDLEEFEELETLDSEEEIEEMEEIEDIDSLEEIEDIETPEEELSTEIMIEGDGDDEALIDDIEEENEEEEEDEEPAKPAPKKKGK
jgi:uncharacterized protein (TIGR02300 family)